MEILAGTNEEELKEVLAKKVEIVDVGDGLVSFCLKKGFCETPSRWMKVEEALDQFLGRRDDGRRVWESFGPLSRDWLKGKMSKGSFLGLDSGLGQLGF
ncbi:hypothetical protein Drorol1_Dr00021983 [Drosera rotundifolia]